MTTENVVVAIYEHRCGADTRVFRSEASAKAWKDDIGGNWWELEFPDEPMPAENVGDAYFELAGDIGEFFNVVTTELED